MPVTVTATPLGTPLIQLAGDFDLNNVVEVEAALAETFEGDSGALILDLSGVGFLDSMMLRQIADAHQRANADDRRLVLVRPDAIIWRVFTVTGLAAIIPSWDSVDEADEHVRGAAAARH
jgi:anti-sigma B factor antagonist